MCIAGVVAMVVFADASVGCMRKSSTTPSFPQAFSGNDSAVGIAGVVAMVVS